MIMYAKLQQSPHANCVEALLFGRGQNLLLFCYLLSISVYTFGNWVWMGLQ